MTPRTAIRTIRSDTSLGELREAFRHTGYSRLPVCDDGIDSITGFIHYKDLLFLPVEESGNPVSALIRPVLYVPETATTASLMKEFDRYSGNMAVAVDEHGSTAGIVTIDDALSAVFGGIKDEYDAGESGPEGLVQILSPTHIRVPGNLKITDFNALLKTNLDSDWYETIGGLLMEHAGHLPGAGEEFTLQNLHFRIEDISSRKIGRIDVRLVSDARFVALITEID